MIPAVASGIGEVPGQKMTELQHSQKFVKKVDAAIVGQPSMIAGDSNISRRIRHFDEFLTEG